jgi:hypothetical protein
MRRTLVLRQLQPTTVVVTLLSPSPAASRRMLSRLHRWTQHHHQQSSLLAQPILTVPIAAKTDALDQALGSNTMLRFLAPQRKLDSVAMFLGSQTDEASTVVHCLSLDQGENDRGNKRTNLGMELFAIQSLTPRTDVLQESRDRLADQLSKQQAMSSFESFQTLGAVLADRPKTRHYLPWQHKRLPLLDWENEVVACETSAPSSGWNAGELKEIVIPAYWGDSYADQRTLFTSLEDSRHLTRPVTGLYQLPKSRVCIRPLPMAKEDRNVPSPSLIFHSEDLENAGMLNKDDATTKAVKIGYTGRAARGQLILLGTTSESTGVDIRLCSAKKPSSMFAEAQESLLASSLSELQSTRVLTHRETAATGESDPNINKMDCWVEFRANMRNPKGFLPHQQ